jgi:putative phosphoesterase
MMRIGILSDTHDQVARTVTAVAMLIAEGAEALFHCGDLTGPEVVSACGRLPSYFVFGNNDFEEDLLRREMARVGGTCLGRGGDLVLEERRIAMTHGDSLPDVRRLHALKPDYLLFGHSHRPTDERDGRTRWVNPGALHRAEDWTVAVLDLAADSLHWLKVDKKRHVKL